MMKKRIHINDCAYCISIEDYFKLELIQKEMQELANQNQFKFEAYNNLKKLFSSILKYVIKNNFMIHGKIKSEEYYYTS